MGFADFCMEPATYVQQVVPQDVQNITTFYATCVGSNPMSPSLDAAQELVNEGISGVQILLNSTCTGNSYLEQSLATFQDINAIFANISTAIECAPTQNQFNLVLNHGLCDQGFRGFYMIFASQYLCATMLFICTIAISLLYQFYDPHWDVRKHKHESANYSGERASADSYLKYSEPPATNPNETYGGVSQIHNYHNMNNVVPDNSHL